MASPFSIFRKNQKVWLAVLTLLAMFGFVFLPIVMEIMGVRTVKNPVVVKTSKYGELKAYDLEILRSQRQKVLAVLGDVLQSTLANPAWARQFLEMRIGPATDESVVNTWLLARHAQQMGMVVSNDAINNFLISLTQNLVKPAHFQAAFKRSNISELQFFNAMRDELASMEVKDMFYISLEGTTPAQRWQYFTRVNRLATIEAVPITAASHVDGIPDPTDEQLKTFFEKHKEGFARPDSPTPGFHEPKKVVMEYFKAEYDKFHSPEAVTDEEIQGRYEKNKDVYDQLKKKPTDETTKDSAKEKEDDAKKDSKEKDAQEKDATISDNDKKSPGKDGKASNGDEKSPAASQAGLSETLKKRIRKEIADEKIEIAFKNLRDPMTQYHRDWRRYDAERIRRQGKDGGGMAGLSAPSMPDFEKLAKEAGLVFGRTDLVSHWDAQDSEIGSSLVEGRVPAWQYAFSTLAKFNPEKSINLQGDRYLFWKTKETKERVPSFEDDGVRQRVLRSWKLIEARKQALAAAKTLADDAGKSRDSLKQAIAGQANLGVVTPSPFSWLTFGHVALGSSPEAARISTVSDVEMAGDEFMKTVFGLEQGEIGVAMNAPQTVAYVIRLIEFTPPFEVLWRQFEKEDFSKYSSVAEEDAQRATQAWREEIRASAGFEWTSDYKPNQPMTSESGQEE